MASFLFSTKVFILLFLLSAIPAAFIISMERAITATHVYQYHSSGWLRECAKWDDANRRFLVSFMEGGLGLIPVLENNSPDSILEEITVVKDTDVAGNSSLGFAVDRRRNRVLVAVADVFGNRYSALAAYDLTTWKRLFLTQLSGPGKEKSLADDVAVDKEGNAYVTDVKGNQLWKVGMDGKFLSTVKSPLFTQEAWYKTLVGLNGIVYHPDGYLLVVQTSSGCLYKIDLEKGEEVKQVKITEGSLLFGDGMELLSPSKLVVAANPSAKLVESSDGWETAAVVGKFTVPMHRVATSATVKNGKAYLSLLVGLGYPARKHVIVEAVFSA